MSERTVRANAQTLPEAECPPQPARVELQALAADFEVALEALGPFFYGSGSDDDADAATARVDEIARKIVALPTTDIEMMRLKRASICGQKARTSKPSLPRTRATARPRRCLFPCSAISVSTVSLIPFWLSPPKCVLHGIG
jgi:hypothetical protein